MRMMTAVTLSLLSASVGAACTQGLSAMDAREIEDRYGVSGAYAGSVTTPDGPLMGTLVPITLASGTDGHLFIPQRQANDAQAIYIQDAQGLHPVQLGDRVRRDDVARSPAIVETRAAPKSTSGRSWEREVLIIGGSAGAGTAIGAVAGGKKGAAVGATAGGIGGLIYDLATRNKK
jgi:hypothetical protein